MMYVFSRLTREGIEIVKAKTKEAEKEQAGKNLHSESQTNQTSIQNT